MKVLVVYHSVTENTRILAESIADGVNMVEGVETEIKSVSEVRDDDFLSADGIIAGSPVYFGGMSWQLKKMFDKLINIRRDMKNKVGAAFSTSGHHTGGKETTMMGIIQAMLICGMIVVGDPFESGGHYGVACLGEPSEKGAEDGKLLGKRVAELVKKLHI
ncbi:MAG: NAD(P)H-dependent oxidoreductase [Bacteroidetes bacterium]|nr:NAD(P)H-dependent oxidoreductase [Bacteroidota bacterium]